MENCEVSNVEQVTPVPTRKVVDCPVNAVIISSNLFKSI